MNINKKKERIYNRKFYCLKEIAEIIMNRKQDIKYRIKK